jgi:NodT family efflux transporter outer membrane factor (OMF) lipoprotein
MKPNCSIKSRALRRKTFCRLLCLVLFVPLLAVGCSMVGPDYKKPELQTPEDWEARMEKGLEATRPEKNGLSKWWKVFGDPVLTDLEKRAVEGNLDLKTAFSRLRQARINRGIRKGDLYPGLSGSGRMQRQESSESMPSAFSGEEMEYYLGQFDASWELDLLGGIRRSVQAAQAELEASRANKNDVLTSLMAEVALNYIEVRTFQHRLAITRENIGIQEKTYKLNRSRYEAGLVDELAVQQSLRTLERTRSQVSSLENGLIAARNRLAVLLGLSPGALAAELTPTKAIPQIPARVAVGIPAEAMRRRPDIRLAERRLAAQTARIGAATAELYPKFHLFGTIGLEALDNSSEFFDASSRFWNIGPGVSWNIFQGGALRLNIDLQTEKQKEAMIAYQSAVLHAREEIEDALTAYVKEQMREESLEKAVAAAQRTEFLARDRYNAGLIDFYNVLDAQRSLLDLEDELTRSQGQVASSLARLYKALGGGWQYYGRPGQAS